MPYPQQPYREVGLPSFNPNTPTQRRSNAPFPQAGAPAGQRGVGGRVYAGDQNSYTDYEDPSKLDRDLATREKYNAAADTRRLGNFRSLVPLPGGETPSPPGLDEAGARNAAFARAKEQAAAVAQSSLTGLRNSLSRRGISGGGYADMRTAEALAPAADRLQDFGREQLIQDLGRAGQIADRNYAGGITRRGQDLNYSQSLLGLLSSGRGLY